MPVIPRVLYVDDDVENCDMMIYWIREECGYDISVAVDGQHALEMIDREFFDLFLLDYCLPDTTAIELCEKIRAIYPDAPIAIYSALDRDVDKQKSLAAGATAYMVKPDEIDQIKPFLNRHLSRPVSVTTPSVKPAAMAAPTKSSHRGRTRASGIV